MTNFFPTLLMCATLGSLATVQAQTDLFKSKRSTKPAAAADPEAAKAAKAAAAEEKKKVHVIVSMDVKFGRESGEVLFEVFPEDAPKTVENFRNLIEKGFYNGLAVHRAVKDYLVQTGDSASRDDKARETWGLTQEATIPAEIKRPHTVGAVAMARRSDGVNPSRASNGSQFYFVLGNMSALDGQYTVFGQVLSGLPLLKKISRAVTDSNDCPVVRVEIKRMRIVEQTGPAVVVSTSPSGRHKTITRPEALKGPLERFLERIW
jgi:cyclophilin family peptidyl-prolyl cis-trans isomerase